MTPIDYKAKRKQARMFWFLLLSFILELMNSAMARAAYIKKTAELAANQSTGHWYSGTVNFLHGGEAVTATTPFMFLGCFGLIGTFIVAHYISAFQINLQRSFAEGSRNRQLRRERREFEEKLDRENDRLTSQNKLAQSKRELVRQLGVIDGFIRALSVESDVPKRTTALQGAQETMTSLAARLASGDILREALEDASIREQADETLKDLNHVGLSEDRLSRDLIRLFKLKSK